MSEARQLQVMRMKREFAQEYLVDFDARRAAAAAGFTGRRAGERLLGDPLVDRIVSKRLSERRRDLEVDGMLVLRETAAIAFASAGDYFRPGWEVKDVSELTPLQKLAVEAVQVDERTEVDEDGNQIVVRRIKVKLHSKVAALELLGKNLRLFTDRVEVGVADDLAERLAEARARLEQQDQKVLEAGRAG